MRITMRTNLAIRTLMFCAVNPHLTVRKSDIAAACNASEHHLAQVIRMLGHHGFVDATRGRNGGLQLMRPAACINIGSVFRIFEADLPFAECFSAANTCPLVNVCWLRDAISNAVDAFYRSLDKVLLSDLIDGNERLAELLSVNIGCYPESGKHTPEAPMSFKLDPQGSVTTAIDAPSSATKRQGQPQVVSGSDVEPLSNYA